jgi:hypothetical protein
MSSSLVVVVVVVVVACGKVAGVAAMRRLPGWKIRCNPLTRHVRCVPRLGKMRYDINAARTILIPPFPGSNPGAPASQCGSVPDISVTFHVGDTGNTFGPAESFSSAKWSMELLDRTRPCPLLVRQ